MKAPRQAGAVVHVEKTVHDAVFYAHPGPQAIWIGDCATPLCMSKEGQAARTEPDCTGVVKGS